MKIGQKQTLTIIVAIFSAVTSYALNYYVLASLGNYKYVGAVMGSCLVGIVSALLFKDYALSVASSLPLLA